MAQPTSYKKFNEVGTGEEKIFNDTKEAEPPLQSQSEANGARTPDGDTIPNEEGFPSSAQTGNYVQDEVNIHIDHDDDDLDADDHGKITNTPTNRKIMVRNRRATAAEIQSFANIKSKAKSPEMESGHDLKQKLKACCYPHH